MINQQTGRSKGYAFIEFTNYKEFQNALNPKKPIIFGKQQLVFNSAKNKYDNEEDINIKENIPTNKINNIEDINSFNENDSEDTGLSTARNSNESNNSSNSLQKFIKKPFLGFLGENKKPDEKKIYNNRDNDDLLTLQIKYALNKIKAQYSVNNIYIINSPICEYYLSNINNNSNKLNSSESKNKNNRFNNYYNKFTIK